MLFWVHAEKYGLPKVVLGRYVPGTKRRRKKRCIVCNGAGTLPGSTVLSLNICKECRGYGRLMTSREEKRFRETYAN